MKPLTYAQQDLLAFLRSRPTCPSFDEMREALGLRSKSGVHRLILALEERGYIKRIPNRARCIELAPEPHLPEENTLSGLPTKALAAEARRRGLVLGEYHRGQRRRFVEIAA